MGADGKMLNLQQRACLNIMSQYTPTYKAAEYPKISRRITRKEYAETLKWAKEAGLTNYISQSMPIF